MDQYKHYAITRSQTEAAFFLQICKHNQVAQYQQSKRWSSLFTGLTKIYLK